VLYAALRCMLERITIPQSRYINPGTSATYAAYCKAQSLAPQTIYVDTNDSGKVAAHWLGDSDAETVILYMHGGAYTQPAGTANFQYLARLIKGLNAQPGQRSVAVLMLAYTLAPEAIYPTQLREAAAVLAHLVTNTHRKPSDIFLSGDSAGGNLALSLLSHVAHPHPAVAAVKLDEPLRGALLYSPWVGFSTEFESFNEVMLDVMSPLALRRWSAMFLGQANPNDPESDPGPVSGDAYTEACHNPVTWWNGFHETVSDVFVAYGRDEVLADSIDELEQQMKKGWVGGGGESSRVVFIKGKNEAHVYPIAESMMSGGKAKGSTQTAIEEWYKARLLE
jgi:acetyl esterase/lipase